MRIAHVKIMKQPQNSKVIVVVSAMSGETDRLIEPKSLVHSNKREFDALISTEKK